MNTMRRVDFGSEFLSHETIERLFFDQMKRLTLSGTSLSSLSAPIPAPSARLLRR